MNFEYPRIFLNRKWKLSVSCGKRFQGIAVSKNKTKQKPD